MAYGTRERIVDGACQALVCDGYEATSVKDIAGEAGVAPGLIHYYFKSKEELVVAALRSCCNQLRPAEGTGPARELLDGFEATKASLSTNPECLKVMVGLLGISLHNEQIGGEVRDFIREQQAYLESLVRGAAGELGISESEAPAIADAIAGGLTGIVLLKLLDPEFEADTAIDALARLVQGDQDAG